MAAAGLIVTAWQEQHVELLARAVAVLTEAARLRRPIWEKAETPGADPAWVDSGKTEPADWAEFVTLALAGAAANIGGVERVLAGRPGSWEADGVRSLLTSTVGHDEVWLLEHRTEPLAVTVYVDELLMDLGASAPYDRAEGEIGGRYEAEDADFDLLDDLAERLEQQRRQDWEEWGEAVKAHIEAAASQLPGLRVPVVVTVDVDTYRGPDDAGVWWGLEQRLVDTASREVPLPGGGREPLERLEGNA